MAAKLPTNNVFEDFLQSPKGDRQLRLNISRNTLIAFLISLLIHAVILFFVVPKFEREQKKEPPPFEVVLAQPEQKVDIPVPAQQPIPERIPEPLPQKKIITQKPNKAPKPSVFKVPDVLTTPKPAHESAPKIETKPKEPDMLAALNAKRAARDQAENEAAKINAEAAAREIGPSADEKRDAKIKSNFQNGTNGIFEIISLGEQSATFTFRGW
jgi:type IV secretory pathway VirB10-like protein